MMRRLSWHIPFLLAGVAILHGGVVHRYSFDGEGKTAIDSIGGKHGTMTGGVTLKGEGFVELDGSNDLIELPAGLISKLNNLSIETWVVWRGPSTSQWQNVLLFGNGSSHWMYLTPNAQKKARFAVAGGGAERKAFATAPITSDGTTVTHLAVTIDGEADTAFFYVDGVQKGYVTRIPDLTSFEDTANFIGKPLYRGFPSFNGRILEVRIHDKALSGDKMKRGFDFGPDMLLGPAINLFQVDNEVVQSNSEVTFIWEASAESKVTIEPGVISNAANTGSATVNVLESTSFTLTAEDEDGARSSRITIVVDDRPIINSFNASTDGIQKIGDKVNLSWDISPADFVQIKPDAPAISGLTGSVQVPIRATTEFTLLARNRHGSSLATVEVVMPEVGPLKISEFVADNDEAHADDHGEYPDWIEIRNAGTPATIQNVELFGFNVDWRYNDENENLPANWARSAHGVGGDWTLAGAPIGRESSVLPEPLVTDLNPTYAAGTVTYYFERDFNLTAQQLAGAESLEITHQIDDGAIFYLNGIKAGSFNMAGNAVNPETLANPTVGNASIETLSISADSLVKGTNRLSVEVHQSSTGSSDIVFGFKLDLRFLLSPTGPAPSTVDLSRWFLTDSEKNLKMWTFPAGTTLSSGARLVVYASGKDARGPKGNFHTNFKLDPSKGGYLALVRDDGLVGSIYSDYPAQRENISYGLLESGKLPVGSKAGDYGFFTTPTPKHINQDGFLDFVKDTKFSQDRGFHETAFTLQITTSTPNALIYYTLDGSEPSITNGTLYQSPFEISSTTCVRARAYKSGLHPTNIDTHTYFFLKDVVRQSINGQAPNGWPSNSINGQTISYGMDPDIVGGFNTESEVIESLKSISTMSIVTDLDHLFDNSQGIYVNAGRKGKSWERPSSLELIHPDGSKGFQINMGLRIRGGYSRQGRNPKHSFRIFFRGEYGEGSLKYPLFEDEGSDKFDKFDFRTSQNYSWAFGGPNKNTMVREVFSRDLQGAMGWPYTRSRYYHLYLNGVYWGLFQTQERVGADFCANYLGGKPEDYDVMKQADNRDMSATAGQIDDYNLFWEQANTGFKNDANYYKSQGLNSDGVTPNPAYRKYLDPDNLIDYMIITYWTADRDGPGSKYTRPRPNNYYCFFNRVNPQGFQFMEHDSEHSLGANENNMVTPRLTDDSRTWNKAWFNAHWLHERLTQNPEYVVRFYDRVYKHLYNDGLLVPSNAIQRLEKRVSQIDKAIIAESARWGDQKTHPPRNHDNWLSDVQSVRNWINNREGTFLSQLRGQNWYPNTNAPSMGSNGGEVSAGYRLSLTSGQGTIYYTLDETDPRARGGTISGTAQKYSSRFTLPGPRVVVKTRVLNGQEWSPLREAVFLVGVQPATAQNLAIIEINYNPAKPTAAELASKPDLDSDDFEYLELKNLGTKTISLAGMKFTNGVTFTFGDFNLTGGQQVVVVKNRAAFEIRYGKNHNIVGEYTGSLRNSGEKLELIGTSGTEIRNFSYGDGGSWPGRADGKGSSLEIIDPKGDPAASSNWRSSSEVGGTPGGEGLGADNRVVINEVLTHTDPPLKDAIELHNTTDTPIDLGGWLMSDNDNDFRKFTIPTGTTIPAGGYMVFTEDQFNPDPTRPQNNGFALSSAEGDSVWLVQADTLGNLQRFVDHVEFPAAPNGESFGRWPNATGKLQPMLSRSLGKANPGPRIGPVVVTEIHYNPHSGNQSEEFIEIGNPTATAISLANWKLRGGIDFDFPAWANLPAGEILLLVNFNSDDPYKSADFKDAYGIKKSVNLLGPWEGGNLDGNQTIRLLRSGILQEEPGKTPFYPGLMEDEVKYDDTAPWPTKANGQGASLNRKSLASWAHDPANWDALNPSPGEYPGLGGGDSDSDGMPDDWENLHFGNTDQSATADFDDDGLANLLEYALGSSPANSNSFNLPVAGLYQGKYLTVTYKQLVDAADLTYKIEVADTLDTWESGNGITEVLSTANDGDYNLVTIRDKKGITGHPMRFIRIVVERP